MHRSAEKRLRKNGIPFEPAGAQDDPVAGADVDRPLRQRDSRSGDFSGVGEESFGAGVRVQCNSRIQQALEQARDQRGASDAQVAGAFVDRRVQPGSGLGVEPDVYLNWQIANDVTLALRYGVFFPNRDAFGSGAAGETRQFFFGGLTFAF